MSNERSDLSVGIDRQEKSDDRVGLVDIGTTTEIDLRDQSLVQRYGAEIVKQMRMLNVG